MSRFSNARNGVFGAIQWCVNVLCVNALWLVFSIPLVTAGASTTALYYTVTKVIRNHRSYIFREFWQSFKSNFKQSTIIWLLYAVLMVILWLDIRIMSAADGMVASFLTYVFAICMVIVSAVLLYALAYGARFEQTVRRTLTNSGLMALRHLPKTLLLIVITVAALLCVYLIGMTIFFVPALAAFFDSMILESIFIQYMSEEDREKENIRNHPEQYEYLNRGD